MRPFIPTFGTGPSAGSDSWNPTGCTGRNCCSSSRSIGGRSCRRAGYTPSGTPGSARSALRHPAAAYCPVCCRPLSFCRCPQPHHRRRPTGRDFVAPPSRKSSCSRPGHWPRTRSTGRSTVFPSGIYAFWRINFVLSTPTTSSETNQYAFFSQFLITPWKIHKVSNSQKHFLGHK